MDLTCNERLSLTCLSDETSSGSSDLIALPDRRMDYDPKVVRNLLEHELFTTPSCDYFDHVQDDMQPFMRKVVTTWMLEVCEEQKCEEQTFPLSVNYLDRFLCSLAVPRTQLQLLASACLLVASKMRQCNPLSVHLLCAYTDNSITPDELRSWELLLVQRLEWQMSAVTAYDLVEHILARITCGPTRSMLRRHSHTIASLCYTETDFMRIRPSVTAAACIISAARGMSTSLGGEEVIAEISNGLISLTSLCPVLVYKTVVHVERLLAKEMMAITSTDTKPLSPLPSDTKLTPTTPTHVHDVHF